MTMSSETSSYLGFADGVFDAYQNRYKIRGRSAAGGQGQHGLDGILVAVDHARRAIWIGNIPAAIGYGRHSSQLGRRESRAAPLRSNVGMVPGNPVHLVDI